MKLQKAPKKTVDKKKTFLEYKAYDDSIWHKEYYDEVSGGYVVTDQRRIRVPKPGKSYKTEIDKYNKELYMAKVFAMAGYKVCMVYEPPNESVPDVLIDGIKADLKRTRGLANIVNMGKDAIKTKKAELVLFQFDRTLEDVYPKICELQRKGIHGKYFITGNEKEIYDF